ncbi:uncharacterized protein EI90DRAFT_3027922 [Cantharellus anzutake]|uniref:uncharacterized protein n=1 Tax=Cantharellus anzutake TaxID=1750568 RepID=UPI0019051541|nr:uncharacterized protein EI90DRAFT_3027922 [Cantharellus anzutake]KAF8344016.1 hypothetical protein EI90DRAFT_3027922 [Cantharellus anzutake]
MLQTNEMPFDATLALPDELLMSASSKPPVPSLARPARAVREIMEIPSPYPTGYHSLAALSSSPHGRSKVRRLLWR